jgi:hypothetical protein
MHRARAQARRLLLGADLALAFAATSAVESSAQNADPSAAEEKLDVVICLKPKIWNRPSSDDQQRRSQRRRRSRRREQPDLESIWWIRDFVFYQGGADATAELEVFRLSGAWSAQDVTRHCDDEEWKQDIDEERYLDLWVFLHEILSVIRHGNAFTVIVEPTGQGFQLARIPRPEEAGASSVRFTVITPDGAKLETVTRPRDPRDRVKSCKEAPERRHVGVTSFQQIPYSGEYRTVKMRPY